jgi:DNA polymerase
VRKLDETGDGTAAPLIPERPTLRGLKQAAASCRACPLWERGTQTVFGEGRARARLLLVGEQPGDAEDRQGLPFVGPAGQLLDRALEAAGIDRADAYVTNAVKHFKWMPVGKRRLHQKPSAREIQACLPWLHAEIRVIRPEAIVALGATAAQALLGKDVRVTRDHGRFLPSDLAPYVTVTVHPSSILRAPSEEDRHRAMAGLVEDLRAVAGVLSGEKRRT